MIQTVNMVLLSAGKLLTSAGIDDATRDVRLLMAHSLGIPSSRLTLETSRMLTPVEVASFEQLVQRRAKHEPVSKIIGQRHFWKNVFSTNKDVLDPRPDTETLVEHAIACGPFERILDLGTGSGAIIISLLSEMPNASGVAIDVSKAALSVAEQNATDLGVKERCTFRLGSWLDGLSGQFDLIVSNPPYISESEFEKLDADVRNWDPKAALCPGGDGLDAYREISVGLENHLLPEGRALFEIGHTQAHAVSQIFNDAGFKKINQIEDINQKIRVIEICG